MEEIPQQKTWVESEFRIVSSDLFAMLPGMISVVGPTLKSLSN